MLRPRRIGLRHAEWRARCASSCGSARTASCRCSGSRAATAAPCGAFECDQEIAADGFFSLGMIAAFDGSLEEFGASFIATCSGNPACRAGAVSAAEAAGTRDRHRLFL